ncbi:MAG: hypothetical protein M3Y81_13190 [Chloroflexota bacterium]|nr:hypothetical protein [Chloroflexota bacterium]
MYILSELGNSVIVCIALIVLGLVLIGHALIHIGIIPGGMQGPAGRTGWSGHSWLLDQFLGAPVIWALGVVLVAGTILFFVAGGLGLFGVPFLKGRWKAATIIASVLSLLLFAVTWTGILPRPSDAVFGPVISGTLFVGLLVEQLLEHTIPRDAQRDVSHQRTGLKASCMAALFSERRGISHLWPEKASALKEPLKPRQSTVHLVAHPVCAVSRLMVSLVQPGSTRKEGLGSPNLPGAEKQR